MEFFKNFVNQVFSSMPVAAKVAMVNLHLKQYLKDLERDETFCNKFTRIMQMFVRREISVQDVCDILDAANGIKLTHGQIDYFCNQVYYNSHILHILRTFINYQHLTDEEINDLSQFLVKEIDNAIIIDK
ncbi:ac75-like protein [Alphabaculovirus altersperidaniae]|uniref:Ac75-like protein n=1 Tax=Spodoptera eridania nucleopolyhedrovirus TaxID=2315721 RepID=A0ABX6TRA2_9ABAC|nr:ac75-like protein [Spodoptera eridania nucleopolyhedrovirus]QNV47893.1 ac75-like protein [Spodoptera eridania nucleopolyhedrovirus]